MQCPKCGKEVEGWTNRPSLGDVASARNAAQHAQAAVQTGHPLTAIAYLGAQAAKYGYRAVRSKKRYFCSDCWTLF